jgi:hypothetical protein
MVVKRLAPLSFAKVAGVLYVLIGFLFGGLISLISIGGVAFAPGEGENQFMGMLFGAGAIILLPIFYGVLGFVTTLIGAALYNAVASVVGGVEFEVQPGPGLS